MGRLSSWVAGACLGAAGLSGCGPGMPARPPVEEKVWFNVVESRAPPAPAARPVRPKQQKPEAGRVALAYQVQDGAAGCDTEDDLRLWVKSELGHDPFEPTGPPLYTVSAAVDRQGRAFRGVFQVRDANGDVWYGDEFLERSCNRVIDRFIVIITAVVFPPDVPEPPEPDCNNACTRTLSAEIRELRARLDGVQKEMRALKNQAIARNMDLTYALSTGVLMTANLTPNVGPGVWLGGELRTGPFALALEARAALPSSVQVGKYTTDLSEYTLLAVPCGRYRYVVDFFGCGVAGAGFRYDYDSDFPFGFRGIFTYVVRLGGRLGLEVPFMDNRLAARAWADILYMLPPTDVGYVKDGQLEAHWQIPDASAFIGVGLVIKFGNQETR